MMQNGMVPAEPAPRSQPFRKLANKHAGGEEATLGDEAMQTIAMVRDMAAQSPEFLALLQESIQELNSQYSADMPRRGYNAP